MKGEDHQIQELVTRSGGTLKRTMWTAPNQSKIKIKVNFGPLSHRESTYWRPKLLILYENLKPVNISKN